MKRAWMIVLALLGACASPPAGRPVVSILSPIEGARVLAGEVVTVFVAAAASNNVARIEVAVDGKTLASIPNTPPSAALSGRVQFTAAKTGVATVSAVAFDGLGATSDMARVQLIVESPAAPASLPTPTAAAGSPRAPQPGVPAGCTLNSSFVADVTIPDNSVLRTGETFLKTWRLRNTSSCDWGGGIEIAYVQGDRMGGLTSAPVLPTRRNENADVSMGLVAPKEAGSYTSIWQLRSPTGQLFGTKFYVTIKVID